MARPTKLLGLALLSTVLLPVTQLAGGLQPLRAAQAGNRSLFALAATSGSNGVVGLAAPPGLGNGYLAPVEQGRGVGDRFLAADRVPRPAVVEEPVPLQVAQNESVADRKARADALFNEALRFWQISDYQSAWNLLQQALELYRDTEVQRAFPSESRRGEARTLTGLGAISDNQGQYPQALEYYEAALALQRMIQDRHGKGVTLNNIGAVYERLGQYEVSLGFYQNALVIQQEIGDRRGEGHTLSNIGGVYSSLGRYEIALGFHQDALVIQQEVGDRRGEGHTLNSIGRAYNNLGQYEVSLGFYQDALATRQEIGDRRGEGHTLSNICLIYRDLGRYEAALDFCQNALAIQQEIGDRGSEGNTLNNIGQLYDNLGQYEAALDFYRDALVIQQEIGDRRGEGNTLNNVGAAYRNLSHYEAALDFYQDALAIWQEIGDRLGEGSTLNNIGAVYDNLGQYEVALNFYQDALAIWQEIGNRAGEGATLNNIGGWHHNLGEYEVALNFYQDALAIWQEIGNRAGEGAALNNIGGGYRSLGEYETALGFYQDALAIWQEIGNRAGEGAALNNIGGGYRSLGEYEAALGYLQDALVISQEVGDRRGRAITLNNIGFILEALTEPQLATVFFKESVNQYEAIRGDIRGLATADQQAFTDSVASTYRKLADLLLQQDRILEAQRVLDLLKVQELDEYLDGVRSTAATQRGVDTLGAERQIASRTVLGGYELAQLRQIPVSDLSAAQRQRLAELDTAQRQVISDFRTFIASPEIQALVAQLDTDIQQDLLTELDEFANLQNDLADIQRQTGQTAVMVYPLILEDRLELVLITPFSEPSRYPVTVDQTELNAAILAFRQALDDPSSDPRPLAQQLYRWLVEPMAADLDAVDAETILYAPDGVLRYIPLAALHDGDQWLAERFAVNHITAASLQSLTVQPNPDPIILAAAFSEGFHEIQTAQRTFAFGGLPYAGVEVAGLAARFPGTTQLINGDFSRAAVEPFMDSHTIVHLATHAAFVPGAARDSFILFGNGDTLTLQEIYDDWEGRFNRIDLIVLSACETGVGGPALGNGEEILGFGYLMQEAGAAAAIASLWVVSDGGTQALMEAFYLALQNGYSKTEALQRAQQALIADDLELVGGEGTVRAIARPTAEDGRALGSDALPGYRHPYYWAPFILIGNGL
jgi:CHAT domain-containing protein/Tfp pilus assembly protein PilF